MPETCGPVALLAEVAIRPRPRASQRMPTLDVTTDPLVLALLAFTFLAGATINGLIGMGLALVAVNVMASVLDPKSAVLVQSLIGPFLTLYQLLHNWSFIAGWARFRSLIAGSIVGSIVGAQLLVVLPAWTIALALGAFTVQFVIDRLRHERPAMARDRERRLAPLVGLVAGTTNSALGASGPVTGSYLLALGLRGREFAFGVGVIFFVQALVRTGSLAVLGQYRWEEAQLALVLLWPALLGQYLGQRYQGRVKPEMFQRVLLAVLFVSAANMLLQGGRGLVAWLTTVT